MAVQILSRGWRVRPTTRSASRGGEDLNGLPAEFLTEARVSDEVLIEAPPPSRGRPAPASDTVDLVCDVEPGQMALVAVRHPSGALSFHAPVQTASRGTRGSAQARFNVPVRSAPSQTRGLATKVAKIIVVKVAQLGGDALVRVALRKLVEVFEARQWRKDGRQEGWLKITRDGLRAKRLTPGVPVSPERSLLFVHGTFSNAAAAFSPLADSTFFERVRPLYGDRIFAFDHFSLSRTPEENARMLLEGLPDQATTFDVITHSRGGLVLRTLVERSNQFRGLSHRFALGRAVLVASPNEGTPLATPDRWKDTVGLIANVLEIFPDNPLTTAGAFVANAMVWMANHISGDLPGLHAMDAHGAPIDELQGKPGPPRDAYSALVSNYQPPDDKLLLRMVDAGLDGFFASANDLVVPTEGGWRVDQDPDYIPGARVGCFGPGGNIAKDSISHVNFFGQRETAEFIATALEGRLQPLDRIDTRTPLPDRRTVPQHRGGRAAAAAAAPAALATAAGRRPRAGRGAPAVAERTMGGPTRLEITVINGDVTYEKDPLLIGHYASTRLTGTESIVDLLLRGAMKRSLDIGLYPMAAGTHQIFVNTDSEGRDAPLPRPEAAIVVGLSAEGGLKAKELVKTVKLAVIGWSHRVAERARNPATRPPSFALAATLMASGGVGHSAGQSARLIAQGVWEANELLRKTGDASHAGGEPPDETPLPLCERLRLIELYLDRAAEAWHALRLQQEVTPDRFTMTPSVVIEDGALRRPSDSSYRGANYDFVTIETRPASKGQPTIEFTLDTRRARSEVRGQRTQSRLINRLVASASNDLNLDTRIGRTLFDLLVPVEIEPYLVGTGEMVIQLEPRTARIPWELLDVKRDGDQTPWAISVKLMRKLRLAEYREQPSDAEADDDVLIIGEPECPEEYARLPGARQEALAVCTRLTGPGGLADAERVRLLASDDPTQVGPDAEEVINTLFEKDWRIVHIAGHGVPGTKKKPGGVVLSNGTFLGPDEIRSMRVVPELVFVNCCYLAGDVGGKLTNKLYDRPLFASGVAGALISIGVRCVVAAGWAVDDTAAETFASVFYERILRNERFIDAVAAARKAAYDRQPGSNTWAAYQCYGDPDWRFDPDQTDPNRAKADAAEGAAIASSFGLELELQRIAVESRLQYADLGKQLSRLHNLERECAAFSTKGSVAEAFAKAFAESGDMPDAVRWYDIATKATDGLASMKAAEQLANAKGRGAWEAVEEAWRHRDRMAARWEQLDHAYKGTRTSASARKAAAGLRGQLAAARRAREDADGRLRAAITKADRSIREALTLLGKLNRLNPTMERLNLVGSAHKRQALIDIAGNRPERTIAASLTRMKQGYVQALAQGEKDDETDRFYSAINVLASDVVLRRNGRPTLQAEAKRKAEEALAKKESRGADFWTVVAHIELDQYQAMVNRALARHEGLIARYKKLQRRARSPRQWSSVYDSAFLALKRYMGSNANDIEKKAAARLLRELHLLAHPERPREDDPAGQPAPAPPPTPETTGTTASKAKADSTRARRSSKTAKERGRRSRARKG